MRQVKRKFIKLIIHTIKSIIALAISLLLLTIYCFCFHETPHTTATPKGATDFVYPPHYKYRNSREGFGYGETNNEGYVNIGDFFENQTIVDILVMGSSNFEGLQVPINKVMSNQLQEMLPNKIIYNVGMNSHLMQNCVQNLSSALKKYNPKYVIIGTNNLEFSEDTINLVFESNLKEEVSDFTNSKSSIQKLRMKIRENSFISVAFSQLRKFYESTLPSSNDTKANANDVYRLLEYLSQIAKEYGAKPIILYHPSTSIDNDGNIEFPTSESQEVEFSNLCKKNGIVFLSMRKKFKDEYLTNHILPYGFISTSFGRGHLNIEGHRMVAEEVCTLIKSMENNK